MRIKYLTIIGCFFLLFNSLAGNVKKMETLIQPWDDLFCLSLAVYVEGEPDVVHGPVVFLKKDFLPIARVQYSTNDDQFYLVMNREEFPVSAGLYMVKENHPRPVQFDEMEFEAFKYFAESGILHYNVNRKIALNEEFRSFFGIEMRR